MRLLDRILSEGFRQVDFGKVNFDIPKIKEKLQSSQLVVIDNVARYHFQELPQKLERFQKDPSELKASDFPNVMLPFETMFVEFREQRGQGFPGGGFDEIGILAQMYKSSNFDFDLIEKSYGEIPDHLKKVVINKDSVYQLVCILFVYSKEIRETSIIASFTIPVGVDGRIISTDDNFPFIGMIHLELPYIQGEKEYGMKLLSTAYLFPCLLALSFMHCRNVKVMEEIPPPKLSKKWQKKTGKPLLRYRILQIDHMKEVLDREGKASTQGLKHALHICRGHFKTYGKDGKGLLFGKHAATVWIPMHTRGSKEEGVVVKDYEVVK